MEQKNSSLFESATVPDLDLTRVDEPLQDPLQAQRNLMEERVEQVPPDQQTLDDEVLQILQQDQLQAQSAPLFDPANALIKAGILSPPQVESLRKNGANRPGYDLIVDVMEKKIALQRPVAEALSSETGFQLIPLRREEDFHTAALDGYELEQLEQDRILPYEQIGSTVKVAIADERGLVALNQFKTRERQQFEPAIVTLSNLEDGFRIMREKLITSMKGADAALFSGDVIGFVNLLLHASTSDGVSDIHIEPYAKSAVIRRRIDGVMQVWPTSEFLFENFVAITTRVKILAALNISEKRLPQDGAITITHDDLDVDIRVSVLPALFGERVVMRILNKGALDMNVDALGFDERELSALKRAVDAPQGMVLVTGPTGSGKSTTLYSVLNRINKPELNILTAEDPVEYQMEGIGQVQIKDEIGLSFSSVLRSFLRQDPDVILVGEIRDKETVDIAIKAALTGHLVLSTLHTNDAPSTVTRLLNIGVPGYMIASSLKLVLAQRLIRRNCPECREIDESLQLTDLKQLGFHSEEIHFQKGAGCDHCNGSGYKGRRGVYEVLEITDAIRDAIDHGKTADELRQVAQQEGFRTMQEIARELIVSGDLSFVEYGRVMLME